jgi:DNA-binding MarR family transcriptional regulator
MEERGLLLRERSLVDARRRELRLTPAGEKLFSKASSRIASHEARMKRLFSPQELRSLRNMLRRFESA